MSKTTLNMMLLDVTDNALSIIYAACRQCYSRSFAGDLTMRESINKKQKADFVRRIVASGHESPLEHVKFTFAIEGVSRALTHQLVRHRLASYSQQSQRYVKGHDFEYIIPPSIEQDKQLKRAFIKTMEDIQESYDEIFGKLSKKDKMQDKAAEDARFVLPQAAETKIVVTMNCRELLHFFKQRCCVRAQWEIKDLADKMLVLCAKKLPEVFESAGPKCVDLGYCPEGKQFACGRYPLKK